MVFDSKFARIYCFLFSKWQVFLFGSEVTRLYSFWFANGTSLLVSGSEVARLCCVTQVAWICCLFHKYHNFGYILLVFCTDLLLVSTQAARSCCFWFGYGTALCFGSPSDKHLLLGFQVTRLFGSEMHDFVVLGSQMVPKCHHGLHTLWWIESRAKYNCWCGNRGRWPDGLKRSRGTCRWQTAAHHFSWHAGCCNNCHHCHFLLLSVQIIKLLIYILWGPTAFPNSYLVCLSQAVTRLLLCGSCESVESKMFQQYFPFGGKTKTIKQEVLEMDCDAHFP
jgi:hypothetical protein